MALHDAARDGNLSALQHAIKRGDDVNSVDERGWTPLMWAARGGHTGCIRELLSSGAVVDLADKDGWTPLMEAAFGGHTDSIRELLSSGAVVDLATKDGRTPLYVAAFGGHTDSVRELLSSGAVVDLATKNGETPLIAAAFGGHTDSVRELLSSGAVVDLATKDGRTPLMEAAFGGHTDSIRELLSSGAVVDLADKDGITPLIAAAFGGHTDSVRELLSSGAVVDLAITKDGRTPLMEAAFGGHTDSIRELLSSGAVVDLADKRGWTPLMWAAREGHTDSVRELLSSGAVVDLANKYGNTPLMVAAYNGRVDTVRKLLSAGASPLCTNKDGETALMRAKRSLYSHPPNPSIITMLKEAAESHPRPQSLPVFPRSWTIATDTETKKPIYQNKAAGETLSTPPGYPLHQTSAQHPDVTFNDEPQEKELTSSGGRAEAGVARTVPPTVAKTLEATKALKRTVGEMTASQLNSTVETVLSLMEIMTTALQSSSLSELAAHADSIRTDVRSIRRLARKIVKECNIGASLSKMETLSHQLRWLACQGLAERIDIEHPLLNSKIDRKEFVYLAAHFDNVPMYSLALELTPAQQADVKRFLVQYDTRTAMMQCLSMWQERNPAAATYRTLLELLLRVKKYSIAIKVFKHCLENSKLA